LATAVHAGLQIDVVLTAKLAAVLVFYIICSSQGIMKSSEEM